MGRIAPIRVISFLLLAPCEALCQSKRPSADLLQGLQFDGPNSPKCSARRCVRGDHFLMLRQYSLQLKQRTFAPSSMKRARLARLTSTRA